MNVKRIGFIINIIAIPLHAIFCFFAVSIGLMLTTLKFAYAVCTVISLLGAVFLICTPVASVIALLLSVRYRRRERMMESFVILLLPVFVAVHGLALFHFNLLLGHMIESFV